MYQPPHFREDRLEVQHELIRNHPLGLIVTSGPGGLQANQVPWLVYPQESERGTLRAHLSRGNPQWKEFAAVEQCLIVFQGPQRYITPSWYVTKQETGKVVPTWNYVTVQAWGKPRLIEDAAWMRRQIEDLTDMNESRFPEPWKVSDAPEPFVQSQIKGIVGVEVTIERIEGKWKVSQNRPEKDRAAVVANLREHGDATMAALVAARMPPAG